MCKISDKLLQKRAHAALRDSWVKLMWLQLEFEKVLSFSIVSLINKTPKFHPSLLPSALTALEELEHCSEDVAFSVIIHFIH